MWGAERSQLGGKSSKELIEMLIPHDMAAALADERRRELLAAAETHRSAHEDHHVRQRAADLVRRLRPALRQGLAGVARRGAVPVSGTGAVPPRGRL